MRLVTGVFLALLAITAAVDHSKFKKCEDLSFCQRHRNNFNEPEVRLLI